MPDYSAALQNLTAVGQSILFTLSLILVLACLHVARHWNDHDN
jgi:predicted transporter